MNGPILPNGYLLPVWAFEALLYGALGLAGLGGVTLLVLLVVDIRSRTTW